MANQKNVRHADPLLAGFLALLFPGLGHYYLGKFDTGFTFQFFLAFPLAVAWFNPGELAIVFLSFAAFVWFLSFLHAIRKASETALPKWWDLRYRVSQIRFSLRSLLITVLIICLPLGWYANERYKCQRLMALVKSGELTDSGYWIKNPWETCLDWMGILRPKITSAFFSERAITKSELRLICSCKTIRSFYLAGSSKPSDDDLQHISKLSDLRSLTLESEHVTDVGLSSIAKLINLEMLTLRCPQITDRGLDKLKSHPNLLNLELIAPKITGEGIARLASIRKLGTIELEDIQVSDQALAALKALPDLRKLEFNKSNISDEGISFLNEFRRLREIRLAAPFVTDKGISQLRNKTLKWLELDCPQLTGGCLQALSENNSITYLQLMNAHLSAEAIQHLELMPLESLTFINTKFDDQHIADFRNFYLLHTLSIQNPTVPGERVERLLIPPQLVGLDLKGSSFKDESLESIDSSQGIVGLYLRDMHLSDATFASFSKLPRLVNLDLAGTQESGQGIRLLANCKQLRKLTLGGPNFKEEQLQHIREVKSLSFLVLFGPQITNTGLGYISGFDGTELNLWSTQVTKAYAVKWKAMNPHLILRMSGD